MLQSWEWGEFRRHRGWTPLRLISPDGAAAAQVLLRDMPGLGPLAYAPHGPLSRDTADVAAVTGAVAAHLKSSGASLLRVEPRVEEALGFKADGFVRSPSSVQPRCTFMVSVLGDPEEQLAALPKDTRYGVRRARREGVELETSTGAEAEARDGLEEFLDLLGETAARQGFALRSRAYYRQFMRDLPARLILARRGGPPIAGAMILTFGEEAYYLYGATAKEGDSLYASYLVQFEALDAARRAGARRYDMWGPCEPNEGDPLWGVYRFKKKFGGEEKRYVGAHEKSLSPLRASLTRAGIRGYYALQKLRGKSSGPLKD